MSLWSKLFGDQRKFTADTPKLIQQNIADGKAIMLDVRSQIEWENGHLKDAIFIPITTLKMLTPESIEVSELDSEKIIYCH